MDFNALTTSGRWAPLATEELEPMLMHYPYAFDVLAIVTSFLAGAAVAWVVRKAFIRLVTFFYARSAEVDAEVGDEIVKLASCIVWMFPIGFVYLFTDVKGMHVWLLNILLRFCLAAISLLLAGALCRGARLLGIWYRSKLASRNSPIDGLLATMCIFISMGGAVCALSLLVDRSPLFLLSALGAVAAVLMLVFQHSLLSLAASVQVNSNRLVNIGDWIVQQDKGVDGVVEAMTLHTVKVRNRDATLVALPVRSLVEGAFVNMTSMQESGCRRYKRTFLVDFRCVRFLRQEELDGLRRFDLLFGDSAAMKGCGVTDVKPHGPVVPGGRHQTNLGAFRTYLRNYLRHHPLVCQGKTLYATALEPTSRGVPLEICAFTVKTDNVGFAEVAADITEHVLAVLPSFRLRLFQECSDIYQSVADASETVDGLFRYETYANPRARGDARSRNLIENTKPESEQ